MKLLYDANLSPKLVKRLSDLFPESIHLFSLPLPRNEDDRIIWEYAKRNGCDIIITTDGDDYPPLVKRLGPPPKVILLESWEYPTDIAERTVRANAVRIAEFFQSERGFLVLRR